MRLKYVQRFLLVGILTIFYSFFIFFQDPLFASGRDPHQDLIDLYASKPDRFSGLTKMNGIQFDDYKNFIETWKLITVRFREDTQEQRFTYANAKAFETLEKGQIDFPDGATFIKVGYVTERDTLFPSSVVPSAQKRIQIMVHNKKQYSQTEGWGYAIFNGNGRTFNGEPSHVAQSCAACHAIAKNRGFVFSQLIRVGVTSFGESNVPTLNELGLKFEKKPRASLPELIDRNIAASTQYVYFLKGGIQKRIFEGTLNEALPLLIDKAKETAAPAVLISSDEKLFSVAYVEKNSNICRRNQTLVRTVRTVFDNANVNETILKLGHHCLGKRLQ